jgi:hypothetical protein
MKMLHRKFLNTLLALVLAASNVAFAPANAATDMYGNSEEPTSGTILADTFLVRPVMVVATVAGIAAFIVSLPFSALGGNVDEAGKTLVMDPIEYTFMRPLGEM